MRLHRGAAALDRLAALELAVCRRIQALSTAPARRFFAAVSRLGDGWLWGALALLLPAIAGEAGVAAALEMALAGLVALPTYKLLKRSTARARPCAASRDLAPILAPLDTYSFPSGHTLHAVAFTTVAGGHFPELLWLLVPFTLLVALSRLVLSLHYPTDVAAGACLGAFIAWLVPRTL